MRVPMDIFETNDRNDDEFADLLISECESTIINGPVHSGRSSEMATNVDFDLFEDQFNNDFFAQNIRFKSDGDADQLVDSNKIGAGTRGIAWRATYRLHLFGQENLMNDDGMMLLFEITDLLMNIL